MRLVSGTAQKGVWEGTLGMRRCVAWTRSMRVNVILHDGSGQVRAYRAGRLAKDGRTNRITVTATDHTPPTAIASFNRARPAAPITVTFSENVNGITPDSAVVRRPTGETDPGAVVAGTWACRTATGAPTDCRTGTVRAAQFRPLRQLPANGTYSVTLNPEFTLDLTDLSGNPFRGEVLFLFLDDAGP
jgi:hypothetical protein